MFCFLNNGIFTDCHFHFNTRSLSLNFVGITPGDLHSKGYLCEAAFKALGQCGMQHVIQVVFGRKSITPEVSILD